jgi:hypothetical protein
VLHPLRPQLVSGVGLRLIQGLGLLLDHLDGPALVPLGDEDAELAEAAYQDLLTHVNRLGQVLGSLRIPGPALENSSGLRRLRSKAARTIFERISPTQQSAPERFMDVLGRVPKTLTGLPGRLLLRQHGLVGEALPQRVPIPELAWAPHNPDVLARLQAAGFAMTTGNLEERSLMAQSNTVELLAMRQLLGRIARKHPAPLPSCLLDAEALGRAAWRICRDDRMMGSLLTAGWARQLSALEGDRWAELDPMAGHPLGAQLWDLAPATPTPLLAQACRDAGLPKLAACSDLYARIWLIAGPATGVRQAILADPALGPSVLPWKLSARQELGPSKALPPLEHRLVQQIFSLSLAGIPRLVLPADHGVWALKVPDPWVAPGQWARTG